MNRIFDASTENFQQLVIQGSASRYVLVDFWAPWCQPCKVLKPMLEALTSEYDFILVKVNTEENQEIAAQMGIRGIPDVRLYRDGAEVDRFSGALPEPQVRAFLEKYLASGLDNELNRAMMLAGSGDEEGATAEFNRLLADNPESGKVKLAAANFLTSQGKHDDAGTVLKAIQESDAEYPVAQAMLAMDELRHACASIDSAKGLDKDYAAASCAAISQDYERALEGFLDIVKENRDYKDGAARKAMVTLFEALGRGNELVQHYQRQLAMYLY
jgi:putative thioredoxin